MTWLRAHALLALISVAAIFLVFISLSATRKQQTAPTTYANLPGDTLPIERTPYYDAAASRNAAAEVYTQGFAQPERNDQPFGYSYIQPFNSGAPTPKTGAGTDSVVPAPSATPVQPAPAQQGTDGTKINSLFADAFSLIPRGLISTTLSKPKDRTPEEEVLYEYGNAIGGEIQAFESTHKNAAEILKGFFPESGGYAFGNPGAVNATISLAGDYSRLGATIENMSSIPQEVQPFHAALAKSYSDVGSGLVLIAEATGESDMMKAIIAYDGSADMFIKNFVALAEFFSARGVTFSSSDPGNVFSFRAGGL
ncbi:MAG: hypothetical protein Q7S05_04045 [bacterium]|nr:hypothetical protein [bacterium]